MSIAELRFKMWDENVTWILKDVNILAGSNGSGKSSLLMKIVDMYRDTDKVNYICSNYTVDNMDSLLDLLFQRFQNQIGGEKDMFLRVVNSFLTMNGKSIHRNCDGGFDIHNKNKVIDIFQSSYGEKRLFLILLTAFLQKEGTIIIDEPEMSLHTDWQELLIDGIKSVNKGLQIIVATHSPSIIINGWQDKVVEITSIKR